MTILETQTEQETFALGERFAKAAFPGMILTLDGDLGCGKTVFTYRQGKETGEVGMLLLPAALKEAEEEKAAASSL